MRGTWSEGGFKCLSNASLSLPPSLLSASLLPPFLSFSVIWEQQNGCFQFLATLILLFYCVSDISLMNNNTQNTLNTIGNTWWVVFEVASLRLIMNGNAYFYYIKKEKCSI